MDINNILAKASIFAYDGIRLRKACETDLPHLYWYKMESGWGTHSVCITNEEDQKSWFESLDCDHPHSPRDLILIAQNEQAVDVGVFSLLRIDYINRSSNVSWGVFQYFRGKGYGKQLVKAGVAFSFRILGLNRLSCEVLETNAASMVCALKAGFVKEGLKREAVFRECKYVDSHVLGLLQKEWISSQDFGTIPPLLSNPTEFADD